MGGGERAQYPATEVDILDEEEEDKDEEDEAEGKRIRRQRRRGGVRSIITNSTDTLTINSFGNIV